MQKQFFAAGGTLPPDSPSYVERVADKELLQALQAGEFCYVLDSRQKGKSSLMAKTVGRLRSSGVLCAQLDLQRFGQNLDADRWYAGLLDGLGEEFDLTERLFAFWKSHDHFGPLRRWIGAIESVLLPWLGDRRLVIFIDEIDFVNSLPFATDEFFAGIRECFNRRAAEPAFSRLSFCLLGVTTPSELIQDVRITPFNIGTRIELTDFTFEEAQPFAAALGANGEVLLRRVLHWTGGHPYLTQKLCEAIVSDSSVKSAGGVDRLVETIFFSSRARQDEPNLADVGRRILESEVEGMSREEYLSSALDLYEKVRAGSRVRDDSTDPVLGVLKLSGLMRVIEGYLLVRNRIYYRTFDRAWIRANMPDAEQRRQRAAARRATIRAVGVMGALVLVMATGAALFLNGKQVSQKLAEEHRRNLIVQDANAKLAGLVKEKTGLTENLKIANTKLNGLYTSEIAATKKAETARAAEEVQRKKATAAGNEALHQSLLASANAARANHQEGLAKSLLYYSNANLAVRNIVEGNRGAAVASLAEVKQSPNRGVEWDLLDTLTRAPLPKFADIGLKWAAPAMDLRRHRMFVGSSLGSIWIFDTKSLISQGYLTGLYKDVTCIDAGQGSEDRIVALDSAGHVIVWLNEAMESEFTIDATDIAEKVFPAASEGHASRGDVQSIFLSEDGRRIFAHFHFSVRQSVTPSDTSYTYRSFGGALATYDLGGRLLSAQNLDSDAYGVRVSADRKWIAYPKEGQHKIFFRSLASPTREISLDLNREVVPSLICGLGEKDQFAFRENGSHAISIAECDPVRIVKTIPFGDKDPRTIDGCGSTLAMLCLGDKDLYLWDGKTWVQTDAVTTTNDDVAAMPGNRALLCAEDGVRLGQIGVGLQLVNDLPLWTNTFLGVAGATLRTVPNITAAGSAQLSLSESEINKAGASDYLLLPKGNATFMDSGRYRLGTGLNGELVAFDERGAKAYSHASPTGRPMIPLYSFEQGQVIAGTLNASDEDPEMYFVLRLPSGKPIERPGTLIAKDGDRIWILDKHADKCTQIMPFTGQVIRSMNMDSASFDSMGISRDGRLAAASYGDQVRIISLTTFKVVRTLSTASDCKEPHFSEKGDRLFVSDGAGLHIYDTSSWREILAFPKQEMAGGDWGGLIGDRLLLAGGKTIPSLIVDPKAHRTSIVASPQWWWGQWLELQDPYLEKRGIHAVASEASRAAADRASEMAVQMNPRSVTTRIIRAKHFYFAGNNRKCLNEAMAALSVQSHDQQALRMSVLANIALNAPADAGRQLSALDNAIRADTPDRYHKDEWDGFRKNATSYGDTLAGRAQWGPAEQWFQSCDVLPVTVDAADGTFRKAMLCARSAGREPAFEKLLERASKMLDENPSDDRVVDFAQVFRYHGVPIEAVKLAFDFVSARKQKTPAKYARATTPGALLFRLGRLPEAEKALRDVLDPPGVSNASLIGKPASVNADISRFAEIFLAMCLAKEGKQAEAANYLSDFDAWSKAKLKEQSWDIRLELGWHRDEARTLMR